MMSLQIYKLIHLLGVFLLVSCLGALAALSAAGAASSPARRLAGILHGVGWLVILVGGMGALARLGSGFGPWVLAKIVIWLALGAALSVARRASPRVATALLWAVPLVASVAAWLALFKPVQTGQVWNYDRQAFTETSTWHDRPMRPDLVLADVVKILHPELVPEHAFVFYRQLESPSGKASR